MTEWMDDQMDGQMDDETYGWNDASQCPLLYVIIVGVVNKVTQDLNEMRKIFFLHKLSRAFEHSMLLG
jgi:hypothetical protein